MLQVTLIDRYILRRVSGPLAAGLLIGMVVLLLQQLIRLLDLFANRGGPGRIILKMLGDLVPQYLSVAIPAALFVAIFYVMFRMSQDSELDAIRGSGMSLRRLAVPIVAVAVLLTVASAVVLGFVQPYTRYAYRALVYLVTETSWSSAIERGAFFHGFGGKTILIGDIANGGRDLSRVFIQENDSRGNNVVITAQTGELKADPTTLSWALTLRHGTRIDSRPDGTRGRISTFNESTVPLSTVAPEPFRARDKHAELSLGELIRAYQHPTPIHSREEVSSELNYRIAYTLSVLFLPLIAIPMGLVSSRQAAGNRIIIGIAVLIIYNQMLQFGQNMVERGRLSAFVAIWIPFLVLSLGSIDLFYIANSRLNRDPLAILFQPIESAWTWIRVHPLALLKWKRAA
ncbi:MAG TPA: LPS export ABC transporter permease LptF [Dongiaceae bacterium]|nr:LPS export ABC transporter permease LptF [Dongiaceae bacterium]